jgi:hypothetical protein
MQMKSLLLCFLCHLMAALSYGQNLPTPTNLKFDGEGSFTVPFKLVDNRVFVDVWLNGRGPFKFILDSGGYGGISQEAARAAGAKLGAEVQGRGAGESVVTARETVIPEVRIGGLTLKDQDFRVFDFSDARHVFDAERFDGYLGLPVFAQAVVRIDYERGRVTFTPPGKFAHGGRGVVVPFELERFLPIVPGEVDGIAAKFGIDTGDRSTLTLKGPFVEERKLRERYAPRVEGVTGWGIGGPIRAQVVRAGAFRFGGFEIRNPVTRLSLQRAGAFTATDTAGNIGAGILKRFAVTFDYARRRLVFEKNRAFDAPDTFDRAGVWLSRGADGKALEVTDVFVGGPAAEAGLKVGDRVLSVDGRGAERVALLELRAKLKNDASKRRVRLLVERGGARREVSVTLRTLV